MSVKAKTKGGNPRAPCTAAHSESDTEAEIECSIL